MSDTNIAMKIYKRRGEILLAACDKELLGKELEEGELHLQISKNFYYEYFVSEETFVHSLKVATIANLTGNKVVNIAINRGFIERDSVIYIAEVPHAQLFVMQ